MNEVGTIQSLYQITVRQSRHSHLQGQAKVGLPQLVVLSAQQHL